jgi:integrase
VGSNPTFTARQDKPLISNDFRGFFVSGLPLLVPNRYKEGVQSMCRMAKVWAHPTTGIYYCRIGIPEALRPAFGGKREWKVSLKTRDISEARYRFRAESLRCEEAFKAAREQLQGRQQVLPSDAPKLADRWTQRVLAEWEADHQALDTFLAQSGGDVLPLDAFAVHDSSAFAEREALSLPFLREELARHSLPLPVTADPSYRALVDEFFRSWCRLCTLAHARHEGDWRTRPELPGAVAPLAKDAVVGRAAAPRLTEVLEGWVKKKLAMDKTAAKTVGEYRAVVRRFIELFGDLPVNQVSVALINEFCHALLKLPSKGDGIRSLTAPEAIAKAETEGLPTLSHASVKKQLRFLSGVCGYACKTLQVIPEDPVLASGLISDLVRASRRHARKTGEDKTYTRRDLRAIFSSPLFRGEWSPKQADYGRALYWLPLLLVYTGARREEMAQLLAAEVRRCPDTGIWFLDLRPGDDKSVKTESSIRRIPLHADLLALGFLDYVQSLPADGRLFPKLQRNRANGYGYAVGNAWRDYLDGVVQLNSEAAPFHGLRHAFKTLCREVGIETAVSDWITGHAVPNVGATYGGNPLIRMAEELKKFPSIAKDAGLLP